MRGLPVASATSGLIRTYFQHWPRGFRQFIAGKCQGAGAGAAPLAAVVSRPARAFGGAPPRARAGALGRSLYKQAGGALPPTADRDRPTETPTVTTDAAAASPPPSSHRPIAPPQVKVTLRHLRGKYAAQQPISVVTAYDYPSAQLAERAGVDILLVGDSVGMVVLGHDSTTSVTIDEMVHHTKAARRGAPHAFVVADLPFGTYLEVGDALRNAARLLKEGGADAVKLEGGRRVLPQVRALTDAGIAVMGHVGLTPQSHAALGGYTVQGKTAAAARELLADARALEATGAFSVVLEMVPHQLARLVTRRLGVPTIGIGAGVHTSGQVQVFHDLLGLYDKFHPKFAGRYAAIGAISERALADFVADVSGRRFPGPQHSFSMPVDELRAFEAELADDPAAPSDAGDDVKNVS
jgi:3-methyl-2-oxobutanoate hydroxymethyltransferase